MPETHDTRERPPASAAAPRQPVENEILRARSIEGEMDQRKLTWRIISRFPKILAELAK
jgi:hypothetical protein